MKDLFEIGTFDRFVAGEFKNSPMFPVTIVAEEVALANAGADHTLLKRLYREFFKGAVSSPEDAVTASLKAVQLAAGGYDQALKAFTAFFAKMQLEDRVRFYAALDSKAGSLDIKNPCDWIVLDAIHDLTAFFPGEKSQERTVTIKCSYCPQTPETFKIKLGELGDVIWDRHLPTELTFEDQVLYCVLNMWLHPTDRRDYSCIGGDPDADETDWTKEPELYKQLRALKDAVTKRYYTELKAARK